MPNTRILLWFALAAILFYNYQAWMHDYPASGPAASASSATGATGAASSLRDSIPQAAGSPQLPVPPPPATPTAATTAAPPSAALPASTLPSAATPATDAAPSEPLHVATDVLDVVINLKGGELDQA